MLEYDGLKQNNTLFILMKDEVLFGFFWGGEGFFSKFSLPLSILALQCDNTLMASAQGEIEA